MKTRITPLNILVSACLVAIFYQLLSGSVGLTFLGIVPLLGLALMCFITDIIFRNFLTDFKRIWIVEFVFIIFAAVLLIAIQRI